MSQSLNAAAPAPLRLLLDAIEKLGRLDGWIGAACLVTLTLLMLAEITVRALSNTAGNAGRRVKESSMRPPSRSMAR